MNIAEATRSRLVGAIGTMTPTDFSKDPGKHFTRIKHSYDNGIYAPSRFILADKPQRLL